METISLRIGEDLLDQIDSRLTYGDSRSEWLRDAAEVKLAILDELEEDMTNEERTEFVVEAIRDASSD